MKKNILLVYGSGGHNEEMIRLHDQLHDLLSQCNHELYFLSFCDDDVKHVVTKDKVIVPSVTDKFSYIKLFLKIPVKTIQAISALNTLHKKNSIDYMITTGPGIGALAGLYFKFKKTKVISIENSSRFYSKSLTARALYYLADYFIVQNEELLKIYDKAIYKGRL